MSTAHRVAVAGTLLAASLTLVTVGVPVPLGRADCAWPADGALSAGVRHRVRGSAFGSATLAPAISGQRAWASAWR